MPTYDYECEDHGYFEKNQRMADHARAECPTCESECKQVMLSAPNLDQSAMAALGMPGAGMKQGNDMVKRHTRVDQRHRHGTKDRGDYADQ